MLVLTHDAWTERVSSLPARSGVRAVSFDEIVPLAITGPVVDKL